MHRELRSSLEQFCDVADVSYDVACCRHPVFIILPQNGTIVGRTIAGDTKSVQPGATRHSRLPSAPCYSSPAKDRVVRFRSLSRRAREGSSAQERTKQCGEGDFCRVKIPNRSISRSIPVENVVRSTRATLFERTSAVGVCCAHAVHWSRSSSIE